MNKKTRLRVGVLIIVDNKILVVRMHRKEEDIYVLPGGGVNKYEGIQEAAIREVKEEANLKIELIKQIYLKDLIGQKEDALEIIFLGKILNGKLKTGFDPEFKGENILKETVFIPVEKLKEINFHPKQLKTELFIDLKTNFRKTPKYLGKFNYPE